MRRELAAEAVGTALLLAVVVGSGIMGERLAAGNGAVALLANSVATGAGLYLLIVTLGPVSGAQLNPAVSLLLALMGHQAWRRAGAFMVAQAGGAIAGVILAHAMFGEALVELSTRQRDGMGLWLSELVATSGLLAVILSGLGREPGVLALRVALYIFAAYWFTASTSFANPAVTLARTLTESFAGIAPASAPAFIVAQLVATALVAFVARNRFPGQGAASSRS